jgi:feruloyl esterase
LLRHIGGLALCAASAALAQTPCANLSSLSLAGAKVEAAEPAAAGPFQFSERAPALALPARCRVSLVAHPSYDSNIGIEVWMPAEDWNGKFLAVGNGAWAGSFSYPAMARALNEGYATASTDTGHKDNDPGFALGHPERILDFNYRAVHEMAVNAKAVIAKHYGRAPAYSYWDGCSTGGRQALMEAQRYPQDFDGIIAGAPAIFQTQIYAAGVARNLAIARKGAFLTPARYETLNGAVLAACDALDGVKDGFLADPRQCTFDPGTLLCKAGVSEGCLTAAQIEAVRAAYAPIRTSSGQQISPGMSYGTTLMWDALTAGDGPPRDPLSVFSHLTYQDPNWNWRQFDLEREVKTANEKVGSINAIDPDLRAFKANGGKLIVYHGWNDQFISPGFTLNYYESVLEHLGPDQGDWLRLFMVPGMGHCRGGAGPDQFNALGALERWRESNDAPDSLTAARANNGSVEMTRPLCPYPQTAVYNGSGSTNDAASFSCQAP